MLSKYLYPKLHDDIVFDFCKKCKKGTIGGVSVTLHPKFFDIVKQKYDMVKAQNFDEKFTGGSSIRTVETQISLRISNAAKAGNEFRRRRSDMKYAKTDLSSLSFSAFFNM